MGKFADWANELDGAPKAEAKKPAAAPAETSYATSTATTPAEAKRESAKAEFAKMHAEETVGAAGALGLGAARGGTLGAVDRLVGIGTQAGEALGSLVSGTPEDEQSAQKARAEYLDREHKAQIEHPWSSLVGNVLGSTVPTIATMGSAAPAAGRTLAAASGAESAVPALTVAGQKLGQLAANPEARLAAQNFVAGTMNEESDDAKKQIQSGAVAAGTGAIAGKVAEATLGKALHGATARESRGLVRDIMRNEETDVAATATARRRFMERADAAVNEVRSDKQIASAIRNGEAESAANMARSKLQVISEPRKGLYAELDSHGVLGIDQLDAAIRKAEKVATGARKRALQSFREELANDWIPKWEKEGMLVRREGKPMGVSGLGVREWVTDAQNSASTVIGQIDEGSRKQVKSALEDVAEDVWHGHLNAMARDHKELVQNIRTYDRRASGLLALEKIMQQRKEKDAEGLLGFAKKHANSAAAAVTGGAGVTAALGHPTAALLGLGSYAMAKKAPAGLRYMNDKILVPLQRAAESGVPLATAMSAAAEQGIPAGLVRAAYAGAIQPGPLVQSAGEALGSAYDKAKELGQ